MLHDVDEALSGLLGTAVTALGAEEVVLSFQSPAARDSRPADAPTVALFLYDVRENLTGRGADWTQTRDHDHRVAVRQLAPRRYELSYLVTAHAATVSDEHRLLGLVLTAVAVLDTVPARCLVGSLARAGLPVGLRVAAPAPAAAPWDLWRALGIAPRACLDLVVTATLIPAAAPEVAPAAEHLVLDVDAADTSRRTLRADQPDRASRAGETRRWATTRVRERREPKG
jgi:hypothetical protein